MNTSFGENALDLSTTTEYQLFSSMLREVLRELATIKADIVSLKVQGMRPAREMRLKLDQPSVFDSILNPARNFLQPKDASGRKKCQFS